MANGKRLLFFDLLRIVSVAAIVIYHLSGICGWGALSTLYTINSFYFNLGIVGTYLLIFVSGAVLEYTHPNLKGFDEIATFYIRRLIRIYPAFWMSLIVAVVCIPALVFLPPHVAFLEIMGYNYLGDTTTINAVGWFIGVIVILYFAYPFLSAAIRKHPYFTFFLIVVIEIPVRYFLCTHSFPAFRVQPDRWLPFCSFLEFGLGIWIVQQNLYPKWTYNSSALSFLAEISFYVFLTHYLVGFVELARISLLIYIPALMLLSWLMMLGDQRIQVWVKKGLQVISPDPELGMPVLPGRG